MNRECGLAVGITGLILLLWLGPIWAQVPAGNDKSDDRLNTGGGENALSFVVLGATGRGNTAYGRDALFQNIDGSFNTAVGVSALTRNHPEGAPHRNTAVGAFGLRFNTGDNNTASGFAALTFNRGDSNTAFGANALASGFIFGELNNDMPVTGSQNTAVGTSALFNNLSGDNNTAVGFTALHNNQTGVHNTAVGTLSLFGSTGDNNTAVGFSTLQGNGTGSNNIAIGVNAGQGLQRGSNNIYLGNEVGAATIGENRVMRLGGNQRPLQINRTFIAGIRDVNVGATAVPVLINANGQLGTQVSPARYKRDIETMGRLSQGLLQLRPVTFRYKQDVDGERQYGLIAEEVAEVYPELVTRDADNEIESVRYLELIPMLLNELQYQQGQLGAQAQQLSVLKADNERLRAIVAQQQERDKALAMRLERLEAATALAATLVSR